MSRELELTALLSLPDLSQQQVEQAELVLATGVDFQHFEYLVHRHRVWPCVHSNVEKYFSAAVPKELRKSLEKEYKKNVSRCRSQVATLFLCIAAFKKAKVPVAPMKGITIAQKLYGDMAKRHAQDIDLLIDIKDLEKSDHILNTIGFNNTLFSESSVSVRDILISGSKDLTYIKPGSSPIELHHRVSNHDSDLSKKFAEVAFTKKMPSFFSSTEFIYLCWHGSKTHFHRLKWLADIALYIRKASADNSNFIDGCITEAEKLDSTRSLVMSLVLSHEIYKTPLPVCIIELLHADFISRLLVRVAIRGLNEKLDEESISYRSKAFLFEVLLEKKWSHKRKVILQKLKLSSFDIEFMKVSSPLFLRLYPLLRPAVLIYRRSLHFKASRNSCLKQRCAQAAGVGTARPEKFIQTK